MALTCLYAISYKAALSAMDLNIVSNADMVVVGSLTNLPTTVGMALLLAASPISYLLYLGSGATSVLKVSLNSFIVLPILDTDAP